MACMFALKKMKSPHGPTPWKPSSVNTGTGRKDQNDTPRAHTQTHVTGCSLVCSLQWLQALGASWAP